MFEEVLSLSFRIKLVQYVIVEFLFSGFYDADNLFLQGLPVGTFPPRVSEDGLSIINHFPEPICRPGRLGRLFPPGFPLL